MPRPMGRPQNKVKYPGKLLMRLINYIFRDYKVHCIAVFILIFVGVIANVQGTMFTRDLIDKYITPFLLSDGTPNFSPLAHAIERVAVFYGIGIVATYAYNRIMINVSQGTLRNLRNDMFATMETLPIKYFDTHAHGDIMSIYTNDIDTLRQMISQSFPQLLSSVITIVSVLVSMLILNVPLTVVTLLMVAIMMTASRKLAGLSGKYFLEQQTNLGIVNGYIEEMMEGQKVVKVFCHEDESIRKFDELNDQLFTSADNANRFANILMPVTGGLGYVLYVLIAVAGGAMGIAGVTNLSIGGEEFLTLGTIASFLTLSRNFVNPIAQVSQQLNSVIMAMAGASRIFELLDQEPEEDRGTVTLVNAYEDESGQLKECEKRTGTWAWKDGDKLIPMRGKINLKEVDFGYNEDELVLHDITIYAEPGQKVALVGATGAGKTTITNLINRFYDIDDGKIQYDGININRIRKYDLRRSLGVVLQEVNLFTGTVMDNIRYGKLDATDEECIAAAKLANADGFIRMLPDGYDTVLSGDGSGLSQGQRQLISIARAAVADPPVMILDEATSSIDTRTESIVQRGMDNLMHGRTVFVIAHRLSTIQNADVIMVMDQGRIIERGNHEHLIEEKGRYYQLYTGAFELE